MAHIIAKCNGDSEKDDCPYKKVCLARLNDPTISGCGIPLFLDGYIPKSEVYVQHTVEEKVKMEV